MDVIRPYYFEKWRGEICTVAYGKKAFRPGVGYLSMTQEEFSTRYSTSRRGKMQLKDLEKDGC
jgi:hypothetical protein